ncbi:MAG: DUF4160 domain-containing protein [Oscillospiraceae bacterium]|nr:DUF4160 domain-containing protein [Oscillospiraceae bacterium]
MPQVIKVGPYVVFFWLDEGKTLEPIHVHVVEGVPRANATKVWITQSGKVLLATGQSEIPAATLRMERYAFGVGAEQINTQRG